MLTGTPDTIGGTSGHVYLAEFERGLSPFCLFIVLGLNPQPKANIQGLKFKILLSFHP